MADSLFSTLRVPSPALPLCAVVFVAPAEVGVILDSGAVVERHGRSPLLGRGHVPEVDEVAGVLGRVLVLLDEVAELLVGGVDELQRREAGLVADAGAGAGLEHHLDEGAAKGPLGDGLVVEPADDGVEGRVALDAVGGVAFEVGLVEQEVDDLVCTPLAHSQVCLCPFRPAVCFSFVSLTTGDRRRKD